MPIPQLTRSPKDWQRHKKRKLFRNRASHDSRFSVRVNRNKIFSRKFISNLLIFAIILILVGGIFSVAAVAWFSRNLPDPNKLLTRVVAESTKIYDRKGETLLYEIHGDQNRTMVELNQISDYVKWATISVEDKKFYQHKGFKITSIIRSLIMDIVFRKPLQGGSTITQQLVKNAILTNEKTLSRKIKELILAYQLEKRYSKDQILKMYFNEIPYGSVNYGVESAANHFFGKSAKNVTLAEAAILAAIPQAPTRYSPYGSHADELLNRQKWILNEMANDGYITKAEAEAAKNEKIEFSKENLSGILAPHFVFYVKELLADKLGDKVLEQGGLKVITTLDIDKQKAAEDALQKFKDNNLKKYNASNAALVSVDAKNGQILAMVGSQDFYDEKIDGQVNVTIMPRQPGSSIKPVVYAAAFEKGFTPDTILYDVDTVFATSPKIYEPLDYDKKERGPLTMRSALAGSLNIPAVKTLYLAGYENVKNLLENMGYSTITDKSQCGLALVLGGCEVKLIDHVGAFTAFARDGERAEVAAILKVEDKNGQVLDEFKEKKHKVLSENTVREINSILTDTTARAFIFGAAPNLTLPNRPVGAKTGTTNNNNDGWTIGFTPSIVTGVWAGNSDGTDMKGNADGVNVAAPIWHEYMQQVLADSPVETFKPPLPLDPNLPPILRGQSPSDMEVAIDKASGKLATPLTPSSYVIMKKFNQHHDILFYLDKDNPTGPPPPNPAADPMFQFWEDGVKKWAAKQAADAGIEFSNDQAPTEYDDLHVPQNQPTLTLISPQDNQTIESYPIKFEVQTSAPRGISRVLFELDGKVLGISNQAPYGLELNALDFANGYHQLRVTAFDDIDNSNSLQIELNLKLPILPPQVNWINPRNNSTFYKTNFPLNIDFTTTKTDQIKSMSVFAQKDDGSSPLKITDVVNIKPDQMSVSWQNVPATGAYQLYATIEDNTGAKNDSAKISINVLD
ncbi:MAG: PBP1A family penicillin-binding protein [Candidatus Parcubacteria bacterium]|nr:PBP1A family penicillin-binding protein [Candidatus Parcubacteria bacterium]